MNKWVINPKPSRLFLWTRGSSHSSHHHLFPPKSNAVTSKVEQTESNSNYDVAAKQMEQGCPTRCQFTLIGVHQPTPDWLRCWFQLQANTALTAVQIFHISISHSILCLSLFVCDMLPLSEGGDNAPTSCLPNTIKQEK